MKRRLTRILCISAAVFYGAAANATLALPYKSRTMGYSGWSPTTNGDVRTVGMAGAVVGLADTFIASTQNPAGLAMTLDNADANVAANRLHDEFIQNYESAISTTQYGVALALYPWGFSIGKFAPYREGQDYSLPSLTDQLAHLDVEVSEYRASIARVFFDNRLSLGVGLVLGLAEQTFVLDPNGTGSPGASHNLGSEAFGSTFGATVQLPERFLFGISYLTPMKYMPDPLVNQPAPLPGFFQSVFVPARLGLGLGWIPNRFFRADLSVYWVGVTGGTALLRDNEALIGEKNTVQPHFGLAYNFYDTRNIDATLFLGSYYEHTRILGGYNRLHGTAGIESKFNVLTAGWAVDAGPRYSNFIFSVGLDGIKIMEKLDLIPKAWHPPEGGALPPFSAYSDAGLPRPLVKDWNPQGPDMNPIKIGLELPGKIQKKAEKLPDDVMQLGKDVGEGIQNVGRAVRRAFSDDSPPERKGNKK